MSRFACVPHPTESRQAYFFKDTQYVLVEWNPDSTTQYIIISPREIITNWPALEDAEFSIIDAVLQRYDTGDNQAFFFSAERFGSILLERYISTLVGCTKPIVHTWRSLKGIGFNTITAAYPVPGSSDQAYVFSGQDCITVKYGASREIIKGPAKIRDTWPSLNKAGFDEVDMVLPLPGDPSVAYFFSGANYAVVQIVPGTSYDKVIKGPEPVADGWSALKEAGFY